MTPLQVNCFKLAGNLPKKRTLETFENFQNCGTVAEPKSFHQKFCSNCTKNAVPVRLSFMFVHKVVLGFLIALLPFYFPPIFHNINHHN